MTTTQAKIAVLRAVNDGAEDAREVAAATGLPLAEVTVCAAMLLADESCPELLCCLDGEPWAITEDGARLLAVLR